MPFYTQKICKITHLTNFLTLIWNFQYINRQKVAVHEIGHLPFQVDITNVVTQEKNNVIVVVDNTLTGSTIPQGSYQKLPG